MLLDSYYSGTKTLENFVFLQVTWSNTLKLKLSEIWNILFDLFVLSKMSFKNIWNGSSNPFGGLYKKLFKVFLFLSHENSIESDSTSVLFILRSDRS